jgi:hypothetical protein
VPLFLKRQCDQPLPQGLRLPAVTIEAGPALVAEPNHRDAAVAAVRNALACNGNTSHGR